MKFILRTLIFCTTFLVQAYQQTVVHNLHNLEIIKFGDFTLKSGKKSPYYIDMRRVIGKPDLLLELSELLAQKLAEFDYDVICGVPYAALPFATIASVLTNKPMIMLRKEVKDHGTKQRIEGIFEPQQRCVIIEDVITFGTSIFETIAQLEIEGLIVEHIIVLVDRQEGGIERVESHGYKVHSIFTIADIVAELAQTNPAIGGFASGVTDTRYGKNEQESCCTKTCHHN